MENIIVVIVIGIILAGAVIKIVRDSRNGVKCSGCPQSKVCSSVGNVSEIQTMEGCDIQLLKK